MQIGEFFIALGFQVDDKKLKEFNDNIKGVTTSIAKLTAGAAAGIYAVNRFISDSVNNTQKLHKFSLETGFATDELERFYNVARSIDQTVTLDQVISGFSKLAELTGSAAWGEFSGKGLFAGIYDWANASPSEIINTIRQNRDKILHEQLGGNRAAFKQILDEIGLGDFMGAIMADEGTYQRLYAAALPTSPQQYEALLRMSKALSDFKYNFSVFRREISVKIEPYWVSMLENSIPILKEFTENMIFLASTAVNAFSEFSPEMQTGVIGFLVVLMARLNPAVTAVTAFVAALNELSKMAQGKENWIDKSLDSVAALSTRVNIAKTSPLYKWRNERLKRMGLESEDFGNNWRDDLMQYQFPNPLDLIGGNKDRYPPMPSPMNNVGNTSVNNTMYIYSNEADGSLIGRTAAMELEAAVNSQKPQSGLSLGGYGSQ